LTVGVDKRRDIELGQLFFELAGGGLVVGVADGVVHQFDEQLDDNLVELSGGNLAHPDQRVADLAVVGTVGAGQLVGELLVDHRKRVGGRESVELVVGLDDRLECLDEHLGDEPRERMCVGHDCVRAPAGTVVGPHPEVEVVGVDPLAAGQLQTVLRPRDAWLCHRRGLARQVNKHVGTDPGNRNAVSRERRKASMLSLALAGKPNAGKSTFYQAATMADVEVGNYPFTTIDANRGVSYARTDCPCLDRDRRCDSDNCRAGTRYVPVELYDVAGLVPGAHEGRGLGNQFLDELTDADAILHVVDASGGTNAEGEPVEVGEHDPVEDIAFIETEMDRWLASIVERNWEGIERRSRSPDFDIDEALTEMLTGVGATPADVAVVLRGLSYPEDPREWTDEGRRDLASAVRERTKPLVVVANKADIAPEGNVDRLQAAADIVVPATAEGELALRRGAEAGLVSYDPGDEGFTVGDGISEQQRAGLEQVRAVLEEWGGTGVQAAIDTVVYDLLDQVTAYPVENETRWTDSQGRTLPDAHLLPRGSTPEDLAYAVHSDIGEGYLHAVDAREQRRIGDDHELSEGDVVKVVSTAN